MSQQNIEECIQENLTEERDKLRQALLEIHTLCPAIDSEEGYVEWAEALCFRKAQVIARNALDI